MLPIQQVQPAAELPVQNVEVHLDQRGHSQTSTDISTHNLELLRENEELQSQIQMVRSELLEQQAAAKAQADEMQKTMEQLEAATRMEIDGMKAKGEQVKEDRSSGESEWEKKKEELERVKKELQRVKEELKEKSSALQEAVEARAEVEDAMQKMRGQLEAGTEMEEMQSVSILLSEGKGDSDCEKRVSEEKGTGSTWPLGSGKNLGRPGHHTGRRCESSAAQRGGGAQEEMYHPSSDEARAAGVLCDPVSRSCRANLCKLVISWSAGGIPPGGSWS